MWPDLFEMNPDWLINNRWLTIHPCNNLYENLIPDSEGHPYLVGECQKEETGL